MIYLSKLTNGYRIFNDEAWHHERPEVRNPERRWHEQILCHGGAFISLDAEHPTPVLHLYTPMVKSARAIFNKIKDIPGVRADFNFAGEARIYFPREILNQVAELAGDSKKRQGRRLSAAEKSQVVEGGKAYRFKGQCMGHQDENSAQI